MILNTVICALTFGILDAIWFAAFMKKFAVRQIGGHLSLSNGNIDVNIVNTLTAYALMVVVAVSFLSDKASGSESYLSASGWGFLMGICVFGVFDFTNGALMKNYPLQFILVDTLWGGFIYGIAAIIMKKFATSV